MILVTGGSGFVGLNVVEDLGYAPRYDLAAAVEDFTSWMGEQHEI